MYALIRQTWREFGPVLSLSSTKFYISLWVWLNQFLLMPKFSYEVAFYVFLLQTPSTRSAHSLILSNSLQIYISTLVLYFFIFLIFILPVTWIRFKLSLKLMTGNPCDNTIGDIPSHSSHTMVWFLHFSFCLINEK